MQLTPCDELRQNVDLQREKEEKEEVEWYQKI